tara:strand:+ start:1413 stop:2282 length:870 start_codon:yes stop_codon:yes gene_type:complete
MLCITNNAQSKKNKDIESIKSMCGCFKIDFNFSETFVFSDDENYKKSKTYRSGATEWGQLVVDEKNKISIQHLLIVGSKQFPTIVKHWRQDWLYQNTDLYVYDKNDKWSYVNLDKKDVKGQWTQKVFQVDDSPRYEGSSSWVHVDGKSFWENTTPAPLPRREFSKRTDYNVTLRGNRHEVTDDGWLHDQNNKKIQKEDDQSQFVLAHEKGYSTYTRVPDSECKAAVDWWEKNSNKWKMVRDKWDTIYSSKKDLALKPSVDDKKLYSYLFSPTVDEKNEIESTIDMFLMD